MHTTNDFILFMKFILFNEIYFEILYSFESDMQLWPRISHDLWQFFVNVGLLV